MEKITITNRVLVCIVLLLAVVYSQQLCTSDVYDTYLEAFPMKCGSDCDEYKKWGARKEE